MRWLFVCILLGLSLSQANRQVSVENNGKSFKLTSIDTEGASNLHKFGINVEQLVGSQEGLLRISANGFTADDTTKERIDYTVLFRSIIEYIESGTTPAFQPSEDELIQEWFATSWTPFVQLEDEDLIKFQSETSEGVLSFTGHADKQDPHSNSTTHFAPNELKFDLSIDFTSMFRRTGSRLALRTRARTGKRISSPETNDYSAIEFSGDGGSSGIFSWIPHVRVVNASDVGVLSTVPTDISAGQAELEFFLCFDTVEHSPFFWDSKVSINGSPSTSMLSILFLIGTITLALLY